MNNKKYIKSIKFKNINTTNNNKPKKHYENYSIVFEKRNPHIVTDLHKLFGTKPNHKYF